MYFTQDWEVSDEVFFRPDWPSMKSEMIKAVAKRAETLGFVVDGYWGSMATRTGLGSSTHQFVLIVHGDETVSEES